MKTTSSQMSQLVLCCGLEAHVLCVPVNYSTVVITCLFFKIMSKHILFDIFEDWAYSAGTAIIAIQILETDIANKETELNNNNTNTPVGAVITSNSGRSTT